MERRKDRIGDTARREAYCEAAGVVAGESVQLPDANSPAPASPVASGTDETAARASMIVTVTPPESYEKSTIRNRQKLLDVVYSVGLGWMHVCEVVASQARRIADARQPTSTEAQPSAKIAGSPLRRSGGRILPQGSDLPGMLAAGMMRKRSRGFGRGLMRSRP